MIFIGMNAMIQTILQETVVMQTVRSSLDGLVNMEPEIGMIGVGIGITILQSLILTL